MNGTRFPNPKGTGQEGLHYDSKKCGKMYWKAQTEDAPSPTTVDQHCFLSGSWGHRQGESLKISGQHPGNRHITSLYLLLKDFKACFGKIGQNYKIANIENILEQFSKMARNFHFGVSVMLFGGVNGISGSQSTSPDNCTFWSTRGPCVWPERARSCRVLTPFYKELNLCLSFS